MNTTPSTQAPATPPTGATAVNPAHPTHGAQAAEHATATATEAVAHAHGGRLAASTHALTKVYGSGPNAVRALDGVDLGFAAGEFTAIMGPSGSGKSTLMHCMAGLDRPSSGSTCIGDTDLTTLSDRDLTRLRRDRIGFVFQAFNLLPMLTAERNITLPIRLGRRSADQQWLEQVTQTLRIRERLGHRPSELSGGQQQRVAMARALMTRPDVLFADEPTGALDSRTSTEMLSFLRRSSVELGQTIVMVTHDPRAAAYADRVVMLADGRLAGDLAHPSGDEILAAMAHLGE